MHYSRAIAISTITYLATLALGLPIGLLLGLQLDINQPLPPSVILMSMILATMTTLAGAAWYFHPPRIQAGPRSGFFFGLIGFGTGLPLWAPVLALMFLVGPLINGSNQAIWQAKVAPDVQGRVFSARRLIAWFTNPISPLIAGTLADFVLEPAMKLGTSPFARLFSRLVGSGPGSGMAIIFIFAGLAITLVGLCGYLIPAVRNAESILPDHDQLKRVDETPI